MRGRGPGILTSQSSLQAPDFMTRRLFRIPTAPATTKGGPLLSILMRSHKPLQNKEATTRRSVSPPWTASTPAWPEASEEIAAHMRGKTARFRASSCRLPFVLSGGLLPSFPGSPPPIWLTSSLQPQTKKCSASAHLRTAVHPLRTQPGPAHHGYARHRGRLPRRRSLQWTDGPSILSASLCPHSHTCGCFLDRSSKFATLRVASVREGTLLSVSLCSSIFSKLGDFRPFSPCGEC